MGFRHTTETYLGFLSTLSVYTDKQPSSPRKETHDPVGDYCYQLQWATSPATRLSGAFYYFHNVYAWHCGPWWRLQQNSVFNKGGSQQRRYSPASDCTGRGQCRQRGGEAENCGSARDPRGLYQLLLLCFRMVIERHRRFYALDVCFSFPLHFLTLPEGLKQDKVHKPPLRAQHQVPALKRGGFQRSVCKTTTSSSEACSY